MNTKADKTGRSYSDIEIKNISGKKILPDNLDEIYLFFEDKGAERMVRISKN
jgi:hypothetical protein